MGAAWDSILCIVMIDTHIRNALHFASSFASSRVPSSFIKSTAPSSGAKVCFTALVCLLTCSSIAMTGCVSVKTEHRVEPIQITMDVNVRLERELEDSFAALDARSREIAAKQTEKGSE